MRAVQSSTLYAPERKVLSLSTTLFYIFFNISKKKNTIGIITRQGARVKVCIIKGISGGRNMRSQYEMQDVVPDFRRKGGKCVPC